MISILFTNRTFSFGSITSVKSGVFLRLVEGCRVEMYFIYITVVHGLCTLRLFSIANYKLCLIVFVDHGRLRL